MAKDASQNQPRPAAPAKPAKAAEEQLDKEALDKVTGGVSEIVVTKPTDVASTKLLQ